MASCVIGPRRPLIGTMPDGVFESFTTCGWPGGVRFRGPDDGVVLALAVDLDDDVATELDLVVVAVLIDDDRVLDHLLERHDAALDERLLVLRVLELGVLREIAELHRRVDALGDLLATRGTQVLKLILELVQSFRGYV